MAIVAAQPAGALALPAAQLLESLNRELVTRGEFDVALIEQEVSAIKCAERVLEVLSNQALSPSQRAGLAGHRRSAVVIRLDQTHTEALLQYNRDLTIALTEDQRERQRIAAIPRYENWWCWLNPFIWLTVSVYRACFCMSEAYRPATLRRRAWLPEVGALEQQRVQEMQRVIRATARPLLAGLQAQEEEGEVDVDQLRELRQLAAIYQAESQRLLVIRQVNIPRYIQGVQARLQITDGGE